MDCFSDIERLKFAADIKYGATITESQDERCDDRQDKTTKVGKAVLVSSIIFRETLRCGFIYRDCSTVTMFFPKAALLTDLLRQNVDKARLANIAKPTSKRIFEQ